MCHLRPQKPTISCSQASGYLMRSMALVDSGCLQQVFSDEHLEMRPPRASVPDRKQSSRGRLICCLSACLHMIHCRLQRTALVCQLFGLGHEVRTTPTWKGLICRRTCAPLLNVMDDALLLPRGRDRQPIVENINNHDETSHQVGLRPSFPLG